MSKFTLTDLKCYKEYNPHRDKGDNPYNGILDKVKLDRNERYEVFDFAINYLNTYKNSGTLEELHRLEDLLKYNVPSEYTLKTKIIDFLNNSWYVAIKSNK